MHLGLNVNRMWFLNLYEAPSIFISSYFKFWCASYQTFSEIVESPRRIDSCLRDKLMLLKNILREPGIGCQSFSGILHFSEDR
jgi:hypothetical protein